MPIPAKKSRMSSFVNALSFHAGRSTIGSDMTRSSGERAPGGNVPAGLSYSCLHAQTPPEQDWQHFIHRVFH